jgi:hypothetical protein
VTPNDESRAIRRLLLWVMLVGMLGLLVELTLIEHFDDALQWIPLVALGAGVLAVVALLVRPARGWLRALQALSLAFLAAGGLGIYLHLDGNIEWEREDDPAAGTADLVVRALAGTIPLLAPGALAQLGLIGLVVAYRHPALRRPAAGVATTVPDGTDTSSQETR